MILTDYTPLIEVEFGNFLPFSGELEAPKSYYLSIPEKIIKLWDLTSTRLAKDISMLRGSQKILLDKSKQ